MSKPKKIRLTAKDKVILAAIVRCGHARRDLNGEFGLEVDVSVTPWRISRLEELGLVAPNDDTLLLGEPPQTWSATEAGRDAV